MEVILAKSAGFCFGVRRAVDTVYAQAQQNNGKIYIMARLFTMKKW